MVPLSRAVNQGGLTRQLWRRLGIWSRPPLNKPAAVEERIELTPARRVLGGASSSRTEGEQK